MTAREQMEPRRIPVGGGLFGDCQQSHKGVWVALYGDGSAWVPFRTEIEALRHALRNGMQVEFVPWGPPDA